jgi:hypothetical protein
MTREFMEHMGSDLIMATNKKVYGEDRVHKWIAAFHKSGGKSLRDFYSEDVINP